MNDRSIFVFASTLITRGGVGVVVGKNRPAIGNSKINIALTIKAIQHSECFSVRRSSVNASAQVFSTVLNPSATTFEPSTSTVGNVQKIAALNSSTSERPLIIGANSSVIGRCNM